MKEKILDTIYKKLTEAYKIQFIPFEDFEQQLADKHDEFVDSIVSYFQEYFHLMNSPNIEESSQIIKMTKVDYILDRYNRNKHYYSEKYTKEDLGKLRQDNYYRLYANDYKKFSSLPKNSCKIHLSEFLSAKLIAKYPDFEWDNFDSELTIENIFWGYFFTFTRDNNSFFNEDCLRTSKGNSFKEIAEEILKEFRENYLTDEYLILHALCNKYIADVEFTGFETYIVNVGSRSTHKEHSGWNTNSFSVINNGQNFHFKSSSKDENPINSHFVQVFILHKKHLEKISVSLDEVEQTKFIISRDIEKLSIKNDCEVLISKHHGNETIIFDSRKEALSFQSKILELKEGKGAK
jgi:hypothetical protein